MIARGFRLCYVAAILTLSIAPQSQAEPPQASRLDAIVQSGTLRIGMTGDYLPFSGYDQSTSQFRGFDVDMANALGRALGVKVAFVKTSWPSLANDFDDDRFDVAMGGISVTLDRQKKGLFSSPILREGKTPIARCTDAGTFQTLADIDRPGVRVIVNPGGTNERFARAHITTARIDIHPDNITIFDQIASGKADVMMTDASETRYQQKLHPGTLCAVHPDKPFDFAEKAYWLQRDITLKGFVDHWLHIAQENGSFGAIYRNWFD